MKSTTFAATAAAIVACSIGQHSYADAALTVPGVAVLEDFNDFRGDGFDSTPAAGQLDSDNWEFSGFSGASLSFGGTATSNDAARGASNGGESTGGTYAFKVATDNYTLGFQPGGSDVTPGSFTYRLSNLTTVDLSSVSVSFDLLYFNDQSRGNSVTALWSTDGSSFAAIPGASITSPQASGAAEWVSQSFDAESTFGLLAGQTLFIKFETDDATGSGSRDEFAIDNISVTGNAAPTVVPTPTAGVLAALALGGIGVRRRRQR